MAHGIKVSKQGKDVKSSLDKDLILNSDFEALKGVQDSHMRLYYNEFFDSLTLPVLDCTFTHNLGYVPIVFAYVKPEGLFFQNWTVIIPITLFGYLGSRGHYGANVANMRITNSKVLIRWVECDYYIDSNSKERYSGGGYYVNFGVHIFANKIES